VLHSKKKTICDDPDLGGDPDYGRQDGKRDKDEDSYDEDSNGGRKKKDGTGGQLDSIKKTLVMVSPAKLLAMSGTSA